MRRSLGQLRNRAVRGLPSPLVSSRQLARRAVYDGAFQKPEELAALLRLLRARPHSVVVEIGTASGGTLGSFCKVASRGALVVSIDLPGGDFGGGYSEAEIPRMRRFARGHQVVHFLRRDSHQESTKEALLGILAGREISFLFIDGDHTYDGVKSDFEMYSPLVRPGGIVAFHDIVEHPAHTGCQVDRLWAEIKSRHVPHREYIQPKDDPDWKPWGGIGVIEITQGAEREPTAPISG